MTSFNRNYLLKALSSHWAVTSGIGASPEEFGGGHSSVQGNMLPPFPGGGWAGGRKGLIVQVAWVLSMPLSSPLRAVPALPHHCIWVHVSGGGAPFLS